MKLLLTSSGFLDTPLEKDFLELVGHRANLRVAIIPTAGDPIEWVHEPADSNRWVAKYVYAKKAEHDKWVASYAEKFTAKGYMVTIVDLKDDPKAIKESLQNVDVIDVPGGDANYLLDWGKIAKLDEYLKDLLDKGVVYVGTSAGSCLVVPDMGLTWWEPAEWDGTDHIGFGVVDFVIVPHQKESDERSNIANLTKRKQYMQSFGDFPWKVYLLQDGQAVKVDGDKVAHVGLGEKNAI